MEKLSLKFSNRPNMEKATKALVNLYNQTPPKIIQVQPLPQSENNIFLKKAI